MKKGIKRIISVVLCFSLLFAISSVAIAADDTKKEELNYTITSPYDGVDWDNWKQYKASLHSHTDASDGGQSIEESVKSHYDLGYQILAITDHPQHR